MTRRRIRRNGVVIFGYNVFESVSRQQKAENGKGGGERGWKTVCRGAREQAGRIANEWRPEIKE